MGPSPHSLARGASRARARPRRGAPGPRRGAMEAARCVSRAAALVRVTGADPDCARACAAAFHAAPERGVTSLSVRAAQKAQPCD
jgi:hypothetical protein